MTTYIVNTVDGPTEPMSLKEAKKTVENFRRAYDEVCTITKVNVAPVKPLTPFYRGTEITIVEERQSGWTMVNNVDKSRMFYFAVTTEIVYK